MGAENRHDARPWPKGLPLRGARAARRCDSAVTDEGVPRRQEMCRCWGCCFSRRLPCELESGSLKGINRFLRSGQEGVDSLPL